MYWEIKKIMDKNMLIKVLITLIVLLIALYTDISDNHFSLNGHWLLPLQFIYRMGSSIFALGLELGLYNVFSIEKEFETYNIVRATKLGKKNIFKDKINYSIVYTLILGLVFMLISTIVFLLKIKGVDIFKVENYPFAIFYNMSNISNFLMGFILMILSSFSLVVLILLFSVIFKNQYITIILSGLFFGIGMVADKIYFNSPIFYTLQSYSIFNLMSLDVFFNPAYFKIILVRIFIFIIEFIVLKHCWFKRDRI